MGPRGADISYMYKGTHTHIEMEREGERKGNTHIEKKRKRKRERERKNLKKSTVGYTRNHNVIVSTPFRRFYRLLEYIMYHGV